MDRTPLAPLVTTFVAPFVVDRDMTSVTPPAPPLDTDGDGVLDVNDNCVDDPNPGQEDFDGDKVGNACDLCPLSPPGEAVDQWGCRALSPTDSSTLGTLLDHVVEGRATIVDFVRQVDELRNE
jgi:hypothetical protein